MRTPLRNYCLVGSIMLAVIGPAAHAQTPDRQQLVLTLTATKPSFVQYEPVSVRYRVQNPTDKSIQAAVGEDNGTVEFSIAGPQGTVKYRPRAQGWRAAIESPQAPGSSKQFDVALQWNGFTNDWAFPAPGKYTISARLWIRGDPKPVHVDSNPLEVAIEAPSKVDEQTINGLATTDEFFQLLRDGAGAYCRGRAGLACFETLNHFVRQHRESVYTPGIVWDLADSVSTGLIDVTPREDVAVGLFRLFLRQWPSHPSAPLVMYRLAVVLDQAGRHKEAEEVTQDFVKKFPEQTTLADRLKSNLVGNKQGDAQP